MTSYPSLCCYIFFFNDTATTEIYTLSLHDALPIFIVLALKPQDIPTVLKEIGRQVREDQLVDLFQDRSEEHTSELQSLTNLVCRLLLEKKKFCFDARKSSSTHTHRSFQLSV